MLTLIPDVVSRSEAVNVRHVLGESRRCDDSHEDFFHDRISGGARRHAGRGSLSPAYNSYRAAPVSAAMRAAPFVRLRSVVGDADARSMIADLDSAIQSPVERPERDDPETVKLTGIYRKFIRYWAEV